MKHFDGLTLLALTLLLSSLGSADRIFAQTPSDPGVEFKHLTHRDGLSGQEAEPILQDRGGYIWIGTEFGLDRFDGYVVTSFTHDPRDSRSIRKARVLALLEDERGDLWVGTDDGLDRMDPATGRFTHFTLDPSLPTDSLRTLDIFRLHMASDGRLWVATENGIYVLEDRDGRSITRYAHDADDPNSLSHPDVRDILENADGTFWIATHGGGLNRFDPEAETAVHYRHKPDDAESLSSDRIRELHRDAGGTLWIATRSGFCRMDEAAKTFDCLLPDPDDPSGLSDGDIQSIEEDDEGRLWLGTGQGGVNVFDPDKGVVAHYRHDRSDPTSLGEDDVHTILRDRFGTYWFAHHNRGVSWMSPDRVRFERVRPDPDASDQAATNIVPDYIEMDGGVGWATTEHGLLRVDSAAHQPEHFVPFPDGPTSGGPQNNPNALWMIVEHRGRLWTGNSMGNLIAFDPDSRSFETLSTPEAEGWILPAFTDAKGFVWVGTNGAGLWRIDSGTEAVRQYLPDPEDPASLANTGAFPFRDAAGNIWVSAWNQDDLTELTFQQYDRERDAFVTRPVPLPDDTEFEWPPQMFPEQPGVFWISSPGGFYRADVPAAKIEAYSREEYDLPVQTLALQRDSRGRIWFGGWTGEFGMLDPADGTVTRYYAEDGVRIDRFIWSRRSSTGEMTFTGFGGIMQFRPEDLFQETTPPDVHVTGVRASGAAQPISSGGEPLRLTHDQNTLAFDYVGLHYGDPVRNRYRYKLEGFDDGWNDAGTQRSALYSKLPPGKYTFRVQAASSEGVWNEAGDAVALSILPPWWRTWWAYAIYGLLFLGAVVGADRIQRRRLLKREREKARERELEQAKEIERAYRDLKQAQAQLVQQEKMASLGQLTAGIAHEIKNPLNFVTNFAGVSEEMIEELKEALRAGDLKAANEIAHDLNTNVEKIGEHGRRADSIVRSMMQHARGASGHREEVELNAFVEEYVNLAYHGKRASTPDFNAEIEKDLSGDAGQVTLVPQEIGRVLLNLLGNAFDAVYEESTKRNGDYEPWVRVTTSRQYGNVEIRVADNGPGIPESIREKVFEPFFTTKPTGSGTGLGLSLSYDIVTQGHGGTLIIESVDGEGAAFVVRLPADELGDEATSAHTALKEEGVR